MSDTTAIAIPTQGLTLQFHIIEDRKSRRDFPETTAAHAGVEGGYSPPVPVLFFVDGKMHCGRYLAHSGCFFNGTHKFRGHYATDMGYGLPKTSNFDGLVTHWCYLLPRMVHPDFVPFKTYPKGTLLYRKCEYENGKVTHRILKVKDVRPYARDFQAETLLGFGVSARDSNVHSPLWSDVEPATPEHVALARDEMLSDQRNGDFGTHFPLSIKEINARAAKLIARLTKQGKRKHK